MLARKEPLLKALASKRYSGRFVVRIPAELHRAAALRAASEHSSLNAWVESTIRESV